jgi:steroid 5-alpha reductase family enzyme
MVNVLPPHVHPALAIRDYAAFGLFASSFIFEVLADYQKTVWKRAKDAKQHDEKFITRGLWSISRHPKYITSLSALSGCSGLTVC